MSDVDPPVVLVPTRGCRLAIVAEISPVGSEKPGKYRDIKTLVVAFESHTLKTPLYPTLILFI